MKSIQQQEVQTQTEEVQEVQQDTTSDTLISDVVEMVNSLKSQLKDLESRIKQLKTQHRQELKDLKKRPKKQSGNHKGQFRPVVLSDQLAKFYGVPSGTQMERGQATKQLFKYIREHNLYYSDKPKNIMKPNGALTKLLGPFNHLLHSKKPELGNGLSIHNLQKYLQPHFTTVAKEQ